MPSRIARAVPYVTVTLAWMVAFVARAAAQVPGVPSGDLFGPLTNLFNEAAVSLSGAFGLAYATAALLVAGAVIVADHRNGIRNALWVIIGSVILFFGGQIIRMIHG
jgi:type IV secretory pathway VirB2 component (pilin)